MQRVLESLFKSTFDMLYRLIRFVCFDSIQILNSSQTVSSYLKLFLFQNHILNRVNKKSISTLAVSTRSALKHSSDKAFQKSAFAINVTVKHVSHFFYMRRITHKGMRFHYDGNQRVNKAIDNHKNQ